ncbi:MAG: nickel pincer cofactor biosynthesis protein LarC [Eubacteriales bacterium]|nr:nickel pincer cofactor biosynthesis protein LarC [Eubacteriales bacterium]
MRQLYFECYSGISGDMAVAALLDAGADKDVLLSVLDTIPVEGFRVEISRVNKNGIDACDFNVILDKEYDNHDHDMAYLHGHKHNHGKEECCHNEDTHFNHSHVKGEHQEEHQGEYQKEHQEKHQEEHRGLKQIYHIIDETKMSEGARKIAKNMFRILGEAEAKAHGTDLEHVHFHEVGAIDSIVDIISFAVCLDNIGVGGVIVPYLCEGQGTVRCQHGILPIPVPAVANIVSSYGINIHTTNIQGELVTPTGASIVASTVTSTELPEKYKIEKIGLGAGKRNYECPGILRAIIINDEDTDSGKDRIYKLETDIDDCTGEMLGFAMEKLYAAGAKEVHFLPIYMKKNRPSYELVVICSEKDIHTMEDIVFTHTTTIGIRRVLMERTVLERKEGICSTPYGEIETKEVVLPDGSKRAYPEYESVARLSRTTGVPVIELMKFCDNNK